MSEDARGAKGRTRVLYVANPDSDGSEEDHMGNLATQPAYNPTPRRPYHLPSKPLPLYHNQPTPLTTDLPLNNTPHHPSSHPSLSSPSSTSSPAAEESTPPPSTPGLPIPPTDMSGDGPTNQEPAIATHSNDRVVVDNPQVTTSRKGKLFQTLKSPFHSRHHRPVADSSQKRPRTVCKYTPPSSAAHLHFIQSPTVSTPDSYTSLNSTATVSGKVLIVVTTDSDWYVTVDISGAKNAAVVRECIFNKVS